MVFAHFIDDPKAQPLVSLSKLRVWLAELPLLDLPKTSVQINDSLCRLERSELKSKDKLERAFCYLDYLLKLSELTYERINIHDSANHEARYAELFFLREMLLNYAEMIYKIIFDESQKKLPTDMDTQACVYALIVYAHAILRTYQLLMFVPSGIWRHIYDIYQRLQKIQQDTSGQLQVKGGLPIGSKPLSAFYCSLLMASINPNQSEAFELEEAFNFFIEYGHELKLHEHDMESCHFSFSLQFDRPPRHKYFDDSNADKLFIDLSSLANIVTQTQELLSMSVSKKLFDAWCADGDRVFTRHKQQGPIDIIDGLVASCDYIQGTVSEESREQTTLSLPRHLMDEEEMIVHYYHEYIALEQVKTRTESTLLRCELYDVSDNGLSLICPLNFPADRFDVGQFLAMKTPGSDGWQSGLIRWVSLSEDLTIRLGVQLIAKSNQPAFIQSRKQQQIGYHSQGILASDTYPGYPANVLLTPIYSYHANEKVTITVDGDEKVAVLNECVERTSRCLVFTYHLVT